MADIRTLLLIRVLAGVSVLGAAGTRAPVLNAEGSWNAAQDLTQEQVIALRSGGLSAAASVTGNIVVFKDAMPENGPGSLEQLVSSSQLVVIGTVGEGRSWLLASGDNIVTDYPVAVERVFKGPESARTGVDVSVQGGRVVFSNGATAEVRTGVALLSPGARYLFFLQPVDRRFQVSQGQRAAAQSEMYTPAFLYQGVYRLDSHKGVVAFGRPGRTVGGIKRDEGQLLAEVARLCAGQAGRGQF
jgi:hypothetical protein